MSPSNNTPELLSPAGSPEAAYAAFRYGADAIYCGLRRFSARAEAVNFTLDELREVVAYAHGLPRPRRVFVALNTITTTAELPDTAEAIVSIADAGADALILQDMGVVRLAARLAPSLERHASTQMAIHSLAGARVAAAMGFAQVTLARELTFDEVRAVAAAGIRTEVFIHGALCYSYSGLCLMSSHRNGRSGNRGRCAYPCRERYQLEAPDAEGLAFSMKDLAVGSGVRELAAAGVACLKIEGRMKNALYVAAVTDFYRRILDGKLVREDDLRAAEEDLRTVFSRPWTTLYASKARRHDVIDPELTGNRGAAIGAVQTVTSDAQGARWLQFRTERDLELHDGLQFDLPGLDRPYGFAIERFGGGRFGKPIFRQSAGTVVLVELPPDSPRLPTDTVVCCTSSQAVKQRYPVAIPPVSERRPRRGIAVRVLVATGVVSAEARTVEGDAVADAVVTGSYAPAKEPERMRATITDVFGKLGETGFRLESVEIVDSDGLFVPMSHLNGLRRDLCDRLAAACATAFASRVIEARAVAEAGCASTAASTLCSPAVEEERRATRGADAAPEPQGGTERWIVRTDDLACLAEIEGADEVVLDLAGVSDAEVAEASERFGLDRLRLAFPVIVRSWETEGLVTRIRALAERGHRRWLATNVAAWDMLGGARILHSGSPTNPVVASSRWGLPDLDIAVDWTLPSLNPQAIAAWRDGGVSGVTLSVEDTRDNIARLLRGWGDVAAVVLYQDTPLMVSEACPLNALQHGCRACAQRHGEAEARQARFVPVRGGDGVTAVLCGCRTTLFNDRPFSLSDRLTELRAMGGRVWRVDFALRRYSVEEAAEIWRTARSGRCVRGTHAGNWSRDV